MDWPAILFPMVPSVIAGVAAGISLVTVRRDRALISAMQESLEVLMDLLSVMEKAHDPGRDVHDRLAFAMEAHMVAVDGPPVTPAARRVAAQAMAGQLIEDIRRAGLELVAKEEAA